MIKFFRKIRHNLLNEGKTMLYFKYAIGEIILVVLGILIALQINDWNQRRVDRNNENLYLASIVSEINANFQLNKRIFWSVLDKKLKGLNLAKAYAEDRLEVKDSIEFINNVSFGAIFSGGYNMGDKYVYDELLSTGKLKLLSDDKVKKAVINYYAILVANNEHIKIHTSNLLRFINNIRPFDSNHPNQFSLYDQKEAMAAFKTKDFRKEIDSEISYTFKLRDYLINQNKRAKILKLLIEKKYKNKAKFYD